MKYLNLPTHNFTHFYIKIKFLYIFFTIHQNIKAQTQDINTLKENDQINRQVCVYSRPILPCLFCPILLKPRSNFGIES